MPTPKVEFAAGEIKGRRLGRIDKDKGRRRRREQEQRRHSQSPLRRALNQARKKLKEQTIPTSKMAYPFDLAQNASNLIEKGVVTKDAPALDVGHAPGDWLEMLEDARTKIGVEVGRDGSRAVYRSLKDCSVWATGRKANSTARCLLNLAN